MKRKAVLLINIGTPESPRKQHVRKFLSEFLNDPFVIDLPYLARKILVNLIIIPFRTGKSMKMYQKIWTEAGSPLLYHSLELLRKLNDKKSDSAFFLAMRYGKPGLEEILKKIDSEEFNELVILPLFPQFASSTSLSAIEKCKELIHKKTEIPEFRILNYFYNRIEFIDLWTRRILQEDVKTYDHVLFVFHGLPMHQVEKFHNNENCEKQLCLLQITETNQLCYQAQCYDMSVMLAKKLGIDKTEYTVCFQSRFGKKWLQPFADKVIITKANEGIKRLLLVPLSFVSDCLETKLEIEIEYQHLFKQYGGTKLRMVQSLNSADDWVDVLQKIASTADLTQINH